MQTLRKNVEKTANGLRNHAGQMTAIRMLSRSLDANLIRAAKSQCEAESKTI